MGDLLAPNGAISSPSALSKPSITNPKFDVWKYIKRNHTTDTYNLTSKYRLSKPSSSRRSKSAQITRRRLSARSESQSVDGVDFRSQTTNSDYFNLDFPEDFDYDADIPIRSEDEPTDDKPPPPPKTPSQEMYLRACKYLGTIPSSFFMKGLVRDTIRMVHHTLGAQGAKAIALALLSNSCVHTLDLTDNDLGPKGAEYVAEALNENHFITNLTISENQIGVAGAACIVPVVVKFNIITHLNLSGNNLREHDAETLRPLIEDTTSLKYLNLGHNEFREKGGEVIGEAIEFNESITELDLSWNHLRLGGAMSIAEGLQFNKSIKKINLAWNGFYLEGCKVLAKSLEVNNTLEELDLTSNRINKECLDKLLTGVKKNTSLKVLKLPLNPLSSTGAAAILSLIEGTPTLKIESVDIHTQLVERAFAEAANNLKLEKGITIEYGMIRGQEGGSDEEEEEQLINENPVLVLMEFGRLMGFRLMDLFAALDKDGSKSLDRQEIKTGLRFANIPLSDKSLDRLIEKLDDDNSGEIEFNEMILAQQEHRKKMNKMFKDTQNAIDVEDTEVGRVRLKLQKLMAKQMSGSPAFKRETKLLMEQIAKVQQQSEANKAANRRARRGTEMVKDVVNASAAVRNMQETKK